MLGPAIEMTRETSSLACLEESPDGCDILIAEVPDAARTADRHQRMDVETGGSRWVRPRKAFDVRTRSAADSPSSECSPTQRKVGPSTSFATSFVPNRKSSS